MSNDFAQSKDPAPRSWSLQCAYLLPIGTLLFFCTLGFLYLTMRADDLAFPMLQESVEVSDEYSAMNNVNAIYEVLATTTGNNICNTPEKSNLVSVHNLQSSPGLKQLLDQSNLLKALQLIREHPEWNIFLYTDGQASLLNEDDSVSETRFLETTSFILPTLCRFERAIRKVLFRIFVVTTVCLSFWFIVMYRQYRLRKKEEDKKEMFNLISKILDILRKNYEASIDDDAVEPYMPIIHVRDMIIPPADRSKMAGIWDMADKFISASESRLRVETQRVSGEDYRVWRWIQISSPGKRQQPPARVWQGEAFDTNQSINTPMISPTPCLKIRNMFDPDVEKDKDWHLQVQDSILEKCSGNNEIFSIVVEKDSKEGLVYVKCGSRAAAGKVFRSLHGAWFDGRLVTVKFIKLQRFHSRYPDTVDQNTPLTPSSSKPVSTFSAEETNFESNVLTSTPLKSD